MKIYVNYNFVKIITFGFARAITLWPFGIFLAHETDLSYPSLINHEKIHWQQQKEMLGIFFYLWYLFEWLVSILVYGIRSAYTNISFEQEANANERNFLYIENRQKFAWFVYLF